ncbi:MAG: hypothetical protein Q8Q07_06060 [Dehalococcoidales bacterium]|nr:hypothetical protein [Dehalococcoidales bacterium]
MNELTDFIDKVYREPYSLFRNNCIHKSLKIRARAEELGERVDLICCLSMVPVRNWHNLRIIKFHVYTEINGRKVDVSLDPEHEAKYCKNSQKKPIMPVNVSRLKRKIGKYLNPATYQRVLKGSLKKVD